MQQDLSDDLARCTDTGSLALQLNPTITRFVVQSASSCVLALAPTSLPLRPGLPGRAGVNVGRRPSLLQLHGNSTLCLRNLKQALRHYAPFA